MAARLQPTAAAATTTLASAQASLPFPPIAATIGLVPAGWGATASGVVPAFDLSVRAAGTCNLQSGELFGGVPHAQAYGATAMTSVDFTTDTITKVAHGLLTGDGGLQATTSGTLPGNLAPLTDYYAIVIDADHFKVATTQALALTGTPVDLSSNGTGVLTLTGASATRVYWHSYGVLPTPIVLTNQRAYSVRCQHRPRTIAYAVTGTLTASTATITIDPVYEG